MSQQTAVSSPCPECDAPVVFDRAPLVGQVSKCRGCAAELEVTGASPVTLVLAPEVEEDWGE
jgi:alpha-aminoadipate carrier protein LysW